MGGWDYWDSFKPKPARAVKGGIKAQSKRGAFGESWWAKRWIAVLESFDIGARLSRGRSYARRGQVAAIDIAEGSVKAKVQGSSPRPYSVTIKVAALPEADWKKLAQELSRQAIFSARLLAGEMPQEIEDAFTGAGLSLFPEKLRDLETSCSCPDWSNPCKHVAAVYYLLGEEFDRDPFLLFRLRGMSRERLFKLLGTSTGKPSASRARTTSAADEPAAPPEPLSATPEQFRGDQPLPPDFFGALNLPPVDAALPKRLGKFPFWRGTEPFLETLEAVYRQAAPRGLDAFLGEPVKRE